MPLTQNGDPVTLPDLSGEGVRTIDKNGNTVVVHATSEAIQDCGWDKILEAACKKYEATGVSPVKVSTSDCAGD